MNILNLTPATPDVCKQTEQLFCSTRTELLVKHPLSGSMALRLEPVFIDDKRMPTSCTDGTYLAIDVSFFKRLSPAERMILIAHNVWHCALRHPERQGTRANDPFDYAADLEVDLVLQKDRFPVTVLPHKREWESLALEQVCERLPEKIKRGFSWDIHLRKEQHFAGTTADFPEPEPENEKENQKNKGRKNPPEQKNTGEAEQKDPAEEEKSLKEEISQLPDRSTDPEESRLSAESGDDEESGKLPEQKRKAAQRQSVDTAEVAGVLQNSWEKILSECAAKCRERGTMPKDCDKFISPGKPQMNWKRLLSDFITQSIQRTRSWLPPNRRHVYKKLYLPGSIKNPDIDLVVAVDTSGSTQYALPRFLDELCGIVLSFGSYHITLLCCDAAISSAAEYSPDEAPFDIDKDFNFSGGGGTDLRPPFDYVRKELKTPPQCMLYFTDGCGPAPEKPPEYPVLWCLTPDGQAPADWGYSIQIDGISEEVCDE